MYVQLLYKIIQYFISFSLAYSLFDQLARGKEEESGGGERRKKREPPDLSKSSTA